MAKEEVGDEDSAVVLDGDMTDIRRVHGPHVQEGVVGSDDQRRAPCLFYFDSTHLLLQYKLSLTEWWSNLIKLVIPCKESCGGRKFVREQSVTI